MHFFFNIHRKDLKKVFFDNKAILYICLVGFLLRLLFLLFGAEFYFNREDIFYKEDTDDWLISFINLIEHGTYSVDLSNEYGYFARIPGYSFFMGLFYLLCGKDLNSVFPLIGWFQSFLDIVAIFLIYKIGLLSFKSKNIAIILSFLYATYPFIIVWNPVVYSEFLGVFLLILSLYFYVNKNIKHRWIYVGVVLSLGILTRPQLALLVPILGVIILINYKDDFSRLLKYGLQFLLMILLIYGSWPLRNYLNYDKFVLTQDIRGLSNADEDFIAFIQYIYSVKPEFQPQFDEIIKNKPFTYPMEALKVDGDSAKLAKVVHLSKHCGSSFSRYKGYWKGVVKENNCNGEIVDLYTELRENQIKYNPFNFYVKVPLQNLKKAIFKSVLYDNDTLARKFGSALFIYRTILLFLGFWGVFLILKQKATDNKIAWIAITYFIAWYFTLCFGTLPQLRNIEMRYLLLADILLLIPAAFTLNYLAHKMNLFQKIKIRQHE